MGSKNASSADNQQATISDEYLAGFVDGEGCFYVGFSKRDDLPLRWQIITEFHLSQNLQGKNVLEAFCRRLGCGYLKLNHPKSLKDKSWVLIVKDRNDLKEKLIPFFEKHHLYSQKQQDFETFRKVLEIVDKRGHLTKEGLLEIANLVFDREKNSRKRYSREEILKTLGASETTC